ncbi:TetR/AcrR family transcriptional regulator [Sphingomonas sp. 1P06PA]|uniref:TetR/AcrR family transcriptional regulator n=1 Tax=Sphingomonas sp. 1P06PA TaxID=554121 RepID=UPI0039A48E8E
MGRTVASGRRQAAAEADRKTYEAKRKEIAEAAVRVFDRLGYDRASMGAVAESLGVDRSSLYYYFASKADLFDEVVRSVVEKNLETVRAISATAAPPPKILRQMIIALMTSYGDHYPLVYIYIRENLSQVSNDRSEWSRDMREKNRLTAQTMIAVIERGFADGSLRRVGPAEVVANGLFGVIGWTHRWFRPDRSDLSAEQIGAIYADLMMAGLETVSDA